MLLGGEFRFGGVVLPLEFLGDLCGSQHLLAFLGLHDREVIGGGRRSAAAVLCPLPRESLAR